MVMMTCRYVTDMQSQLHSAEFDTRGSYLLQLGTKE